MRSAANSPTRKRRFEQLNAILSEVVKKSKKANQDSTPFSSIEWKDVKEVFGEGVFIPPTKEFGQEHLNPLHAQLVNIHRLYGSVSHGKRQSDYNS